MKAGAIFDQDGLMFDTEVLYAQSWKEAGKRLGFFVPEEFTHAISGSGGQEMVDIINYYVPEAHPQEFWTLCKEICFEKQNENLAEKTGLREILDFFKKNGVKMAVASSSPRTQVNKNLARSGIRGYFDAVVTGDEVSHGKPEPDIFLLAAEKIGIAPENCYVFEDSFNGIRAGHSAGCAAVMIPDTVEPTEEIRGLCTAVCDSLLTVIDCIKDGQI